MTQILTPLIQIVGAVFENGVGHLKYRERHLAKLGGGYIRMELSECIGEAECEECIMIAGADDHTLTEAVDEDKLLAVEYPGKTGVRLAGKDAGAEETVLV